MVSKRYICPMHPEVVSSKPGKCSKCGMRLVRQNATNSMPNDSYIPLMVIILMITTVSLVVSWTQVDRFSFRSFIIYFMTGFFLVFASFKLMDLRGFAEGYTTYDLLASRFFIYGYMYPFIELIFGFLMLAGYHPLWLLWTEFVVMTFSGIGVVLKLARREKFQCACLGTFLKIPPTYVTLVEDFGMALLALLLILGI